MTQEFKISSGEPGPNDVVFDCENCGRSLCIDTVAAGFKIICPHCSAEQQVPGEQADLGPEGDVENSEEYAEDELESLRMRNEQLEQLAEIHKGRLEQIGREMVMIQAALDRVVGLMQDEQIESPAVEVEPS